MARQPVPERVHTHSRQRRTPPAEPKDLARIAREAREAQEQPAPPFGVELVEPVTPAVLRHSSSQLVGRPRYHAFSLFVDGYSFSEIASALKSTHGIRLSANAVAAVCRKHLNTVKELAEKRIGLYINRGLANKATRLAALTKHYNIVLSMIEQHHTSDGPRHAKAWVVVPTLPTLLAEVRKTLDAIRKEVEPVQQVHVTRDETIRLYDETSAKAVEDIRDHAATLPPDIREVLGTALARHDSGLPQTTGSTAAGEPDTLPLFPSDSASGEGESTLGPLSIPEGPSP